MEDLMQMDLYDLIGTVAEASVKEVRKKLIYFFYRQSYDLR